MKFLFVTLLSFALIVLFSNTLRAAELDVCQELGKKYETWSSVERWVWVELCTQGEADLNQKLNNELDVKLQSHDRISLSTTNFAMRIISEDFLVALFSSNELNKHLGSNGVSIIGAIFDEVVDLSSRNLNAPLTINSSIFRAEVVLSGIKSRHRISFNGSNFQKALIGQFMDIGVLALVDVRAQEVDLNGSKIQGLLWIQGIKVRENFYGESLQVDGKIIANKNCKFSGKIILKYARISGNITFANSDINILDLQGARISGELQFGFTKERATRWAEQGKLVLRIAEVGGIRGWKEPWPQSELYGFQYRTFQIHPENEIASDWYVKWLGNAPMAMQPYNQLAAVLNAEGKREEANKVLFEGLERLRSQAKGSQFVIMSMQRYIVGYGIGTGYFHALGVAVLFVMLGRIVIWFSRENSYRRDELGFLYSLDTLIPIISFRKKNQDLELWTKSSRAYFYFHKICGYVLTSFVLAGFAGLTR